VRAIPALCACPGTQVRRRPGRREIMAQAVRPRARYRPRSTLKARRAGLVQGRVKAATPAVRQALSRNSSGSPVSTRLLRLDKIIGQPGVMTFSSDPPGSSPR
jgi:hypothetical protein